MVFLLLGFPLNIVAGYLPFIVFYAVLLHANISWDFGFLRSVLASPRFHRWHHTKETEAIDKNFAGLFPLFDIIFGTYYMPKDKQPSEFGVKDPIPMSLWGQLSYPFRKNI
jgi:sterol desaturase/sphingolipid hydroxylase (fatty acid hydroxylase superfamily)